MKKRANLITRVALAATIFVTALAGVTPMTAKAETKTTTVNVGGTNKVLTYIYDANLYGDFTEIGDITESVEASNIPSTSLPSFSLKSPEASKDYTYSWKNGSATVTTLKEALGEGSANVNITASHTATDKKPATPTIEVTAGGYKMANGGSVTPGASVTVTVKRGTGDDYSTLVTSVSAGTSSPTTFIGETYNTKIYEDTTFVATASNGEATAATSEAFVLKAAAPAEDDAITSFTADPAEFNKNDPKDIKFSYTLTGSGNSVSVTGADSGFSSYFTPGSSSFTVDKEYFNRSSSFSVRITITDRSNNKKYIDIPITTGASTTGTTATLKSFSWNSGSLDLGGISTGADALHNKTTPDKPALVFPVNSEKQFDNGITRDNIIKEIDKADDLSVTLRVNETDTTFKLDSVKWDYTYTEGANQPLTTSAYNRNETKKQEFYIYSDPLQLKNGNNVYSITSGSLGPATYVRLKLHVVVNAEGEAATNTTTGSGNVAAPTFTPASGAYVHPGQKISFASTTAGVSFRSDSGDKMPTSSSGTSGSQILIPAGASGTYKLNAIAYTGSNNYSPVASATYTVVGGSNANYQITTGDAQQVSATQPASFTFSGDYSKFKQLQVDGVVVPSGYYQVAQGSTVITLQPSYLATLTAGTHTIEAFFDDGYATGSFTLTAGNTPASSGPAAQIDGNTTTTTSGGGRTTVPTDDRSELVIMFVILGMLIAGFVVSVYYKNEKLRRNRYMD